MEFRTYARRDSLRAGLLEGGCGESWSDCSSLGAELMASRKVIGHWKGLGLSPDLWALRILAGSLCLSGRDHVVLQLLRRRGFPESLRARYTPRH